MVFNSFQFLVFLAVVYSLYLVLKHKGQNRMLLVASYVFYAAWDWRFLSLIVLSTFLDFFCGIKVGEAKEDKTKKFFVGLSVLGNLSVLFFFKYFNFFIENFQQVLGFIGLPSDPIYLNIILPMGISFYTFQTMSYTIDIYRKELEPTRKFLDFALFVSFFPQLVAGPIERAKHLLPQILKPRTVTLDGFYQGVYLIFWGLFLKVFVADNLAKVVDPVFGSNPPYNGMEVLIALYAFTFQIFCDFAGYSNVARGLGKIMGFDIMINFNLPFFVTNIQDFWNKWHMSLSSWLRDYLYVPLFAWLRMVKGNARVYIALLVTMVLIGIWHGAAKNFALFGLYYGILLTLYVKIRMKCSHWIKPKNPILQNLWIVARIVFMFHLVCIGMLLFRIEYLSQAFFMTKAMLLNFTPFDGMSYMFVQFVYFAWILIAMQLYQFYKKDLMAMYKSPVVLRTAFYCLCYLLIVIHGVTGGEEFIYFQF